MNLTLINKKGKLFEKVVILEDNGVWAIVIAIIDNGEVLHDSAGFVFLQDMMYYYQDYMWVYVKERIC